MADEDAILTRVALEQALARETPSDRVMMLLIFRVSVPEDWFGLPWPPTYADIGNYIGTRFGVGPLSEAAIRYRRDTLLAKWRACRGQIALF